MSRLFQVSRRSQATARLDELIGPRWDAWFSAWFSSCSTALCGLRWSLAAGSSWQLAALCSQTLPPSWSAWSRSVVAQTNSPLYSDEVIAVEPRCLARPSPVQSPLGGHLAKQPSNAGRTWFSSNASFDGGRRLLFYARHRFVNKLQSATGRRSTTLPEHASLPRWLPASGRGLARLGELAL
jgi:hypothetical protein